MNRRAKRGADSPHFNPSSPAMLESPAGVQAALMDQTGGRSLFNLSKDQAVFLAHTHVEVQKETDFAPPGFRPSAEVARRRIDLQRHISPDSDIHDLHFEETFVVRTTHTPGQLASALPPPHYGTGAYAFNHELASAVGSVMNPPLTGLPMVPVGHLSYAPHQLETDPRLSQVVDHLKGRTTGRRPRAGTPHMAMGQFDTAVVHRHDNGTSALRHFGTSALRHFGTSALQQVDDKFNSASNNQDSFSQDQAERYATIVRMGGGSSAARPNDLMQLSPFHVSPAYTLDDLSNVPGMRTRGTNLSTVKAIKLVTTIERADHAYGHQDKKHRRES